MQYNQGQGLAGAQAAPAIDEGLRAHMNRVYGLMGAGLAGTGAVAWLTHMMSVTAHGSLSPFGQMLYTSPLKWVVIFAPLAIVMVFGAGMSRMSPQVLTGVFALYAATVGISMSAIFLVYTGTSIVQTFLVTAITFAGLSIWGYVTRKDLGAFGAFLFIGLLGTLVAAIVNLFLQSDAMSFAISAIAVFIFAGLTAYDTQKIRNDYLETRDHYPELAEKLAISGALSLYMDFIGLFMHLLRLIGDRE